MILVDTSVWIDHFRDSDEQLVDLLGRDEVCTHPFVLQELALGRIANRVDTLESLGQLRTFPVLAPAEVLRLVDVRGLSGSGLSLVDAHLLGATLITPGSRLWTHDKRLRAAAEEAGVAAVR